MNQRPAWVARALSLRSLGVAVVVLMSAVPVRADWFQADTSEPPPDLDPGEPNSGQPHQPDAPFVLTVYAENDSPYFKPNNDTDRYYTNGIALGLSHQPQWAKDLAEAMPFADSFGPARTGAGYFIGQLMFTGEDIADPDPPLDDRPYAGYLYGGVYWQRANDHTLDHIQMEVGMTGPSSLAEKAQEWIHDLFDDTDPQGWDQQIGDEFQFQTYLRKKWKATHVSEDWFVKGHPVLFQAIPEIGLALGTVYRHVHGGAVVRLGFNMRDDFGPPRLADMLDATAGAPPQGWGGYVFARAGARLVEHNVFLDGNNFKDSRHVDIEHVVGELQGGLGVRYTKGAFSAELTYSQTVQSEEFTTQDGSHAFGAWTISMTMAF